MFTADECFEGYAKFNEFWKNSFIREGENRSPTEIVHTVYEKWNKKDGANFKEFQELFEL